MFFFSWHFVPSKNVVCFPLVDYFLLDSVVVPFLLVDVVPLELHFSRVRVYPIVLSH